MLTTTVTASRPPPTAVAAATGVATATSVAATRALPDGGPPIGPEQWVPQPGHMTFHELMASLNPLQHLPVVGMIYRAVTGDTIPPPMQIAGSILTGFALGGPVGALGTIAINLAEELYQMGPAYPGHTLKVGDYSIGSETPIPLPSGPVPTAIYADGTGGLPTWTAGQLSQYDITPSGTKVAQTADPARYAAAAAAYQVAMLTTMPQGGAG